MRLIGLAGILMGNTLILINRIHTNKEAARPEMPAANFHQLCDTTFLAAVHLTAVVIWLN